MGHIVFLSQLIAIPVDIFKGQVIYEEQLRISYPLKTSILLTNTCN